MTGSEPNAGPVPTADDWQEMILRRARELSENINRAGGVAVKRVGLLALNAEAMAYVLQVPQGHRIVRLGFDFDANAVRVEVEGPTMPVTIAADAPKVLAPLEISEYEDGTRKIVWPAAIGTVTVSAAPLTNLAKAATAR